jgi:hypothetical protein
MLMTQRSPTVPSGLLELWCGIRIDPILRCFANPERLNCEDLLQGIVPKLVSWLTV